MLVTGMHLICDHHDAAVLRALDVGVLDSLRRGGTVVGLDAPCQLNDLPITTQQATSLLHRSARI